MARWTNSWKGKGWRFRTIQDDISGTEETHIVHCNRPALNAQYRHAANRTATTKYSWWSFLPRALFEQYRRAAYWYFTAMAALALVPFSPYNPVSVWLPLAFVLVLGVARELWEDVRRGRGDREVNNRPVLVHAGGGRLAERRWKHLRVGDVVKVRDGDYFPADLLLLSSTGPEGVCYVETMNLDGETNLKVRQALECTWAVGSKDEKVLGEFEATIKCEGPNASLYTFAGLMELPPRGGVGGGGGAHPVGPPQLLLRDSSLQNTGSIFGVVVYTGHDTKVMRNSTAPPSKRSRVDRTLDKLIYAMFAILLAMSVTTGTVLGARTAAEGADVWYLQPEVGDPYFNPRHAVAAGVVSAVNGLVLYGYLIPISLYVSLEVVRVLQAIFMMLDIGMYDAATDKRCRVKSAGLNEELGQVDTIFSDKTGTLTCNQMDFFRCSIGGVSYGKGTTEVEASAARLGVPLAGGGGPPPDVKEESLSYGRRSSTEDAEDASYGRVPHRAESPGRNPYKEKGFNFYDARLLGGRWAAEERAADVRFFFQILALCHTAIPEGSPDSPASMRYRAESPDEAALVVAAKQFGFYFYKRTPTTLHVRETLGPGAAPVDAKYQLLNVLEFSSARKRMSVVVRFPDGKLRLLSKGADSVMLQRLDPAHRGCAAATARHLKQYGEVGLRTLLVAHRELPEDEYRDWQARFAAARATLGRDRDVRTEEVAEELERGLTVVGGTGVEDKLQAGVPEAVDRLARAGIKIWVLTGDKVETAINIGYACSLLRQGMDNLIVSLEGTEARAIEERAEREGLSKDDTSKALKNLVAQKISDALLLVTTNNANPRQTDMGEAQASFSDNFNSVLSRSLSRGSEYLARSHSKSDGVQMAAAPAGHAHKRSVSETLARQLEGGGGGLVALKLAALKGGPAPSPAAAVEYALVIDGQSLAYILAEADLQEQFLRVCINCASVLCCRVSPRQKAQVTKLVRKGLGQHRLCLAIGDGANDVGMIQAANVGVGITGVEGAQAAMAADYAIGQFRFLERLLLVHGHWCYRRISLMILYFFYKVCILGWISFYSNVFAHFSGQPLYNDWYASFYNTLFTAFPICVVAVIDQDVTAAQALRHPELYRAGQRGELFNARTIARWLLNSCYSAAVVFFFPAAALRLSAFRGDGHVAARQDFGQAMFTGLVLVPNLQLFSAIRYFTWLHHAAIWGSVCVWYAFVLAYGALPPKWSTVAHHEFVEALAPAPAFWLLQLLVVAAALLPDFAFRSFGWMLRPADYEVVLEGDALLRGAGPPAAAGGSSAIRQP